MDKIVYLYLAIMVLAEVVAVGFLKETQNFTKLIPSTVVVIGYIVTLYFLTLVMDRMPMSIAYTLWAVIGIIFVVLVGVFYYKEPFDIPAIIGTSLIVAGIVVINLWSSTVK